MNVENPIKLNIKTVSHGNLGNLSVVDINTVLPFEIKRCFFVYGSKKGTLRGDHAHYSLKQFIWCVNGILKISTISKDGINQEFILNKPNEGIYIPNLTWANQFTMTEECIYCVAASDYYKEDDYIRNLEDFLHITKQCK